MTINRLKTSAPDFFSRLDALLAWDREETGDVDEAVRDVLAQVRVRGDAALLEYSNRWDRRKLKSASDFLIPPKDLSTCLDKLDPDIRQALESSAQRIRAFHQRQVQGSWTYTESDGSILGQRVTPLDRVGVYVPGGKAAYPSSVLMNIIPAKVAGVAEIIMVVPAPDDRLDATVLAAAALVEVDRVYTIGGAQAVAALAFGTQTVPKVDKIVGPGNIYVARAKAMVFGTVGIDMIAGPSEIVIVCDGGTDPDWIAMDLFSQAEHDEQAQAILLSPDPGFLDKVQDSISRQLEALERAAIIRHSLASRGALIEVADLEEAVTLVNYIAPEHLELSVADPEALLGQIRHAGAIFMGRHTAEALGDYCAGPNHVLPTARSARFSSPLGVYDFQKRSSLVHCSASAAKELGRIASTLAHAEGLTAHARSAEYRVNHK